MSHEWPCPCTQQAQLPPSLDAKNKPEQLDIKGVEFCASKASTGAAMHSSYLVPSTS
jgi:hypothetical protein